MGIKMSAIKLAQILVGLRREKGITQEELASYMGVSKAAVSKWEKEQSYPDIMLLPQLATYFNISIDELLNYSPQLTRGEIRKLYRRLTADFTGKDFDEVLAECRSVIKKYFSCFPLLYQMALLLINHSSLAQSPELQAEVLQEAKGLCERIVAESGDALLAKDALHIQLFCSLQCGQPGEVFTLMGESLRMVPFTEEFLISQAYQLTGNSAKAIEITQCGLYGHLMELIESTLNYALLLMDDLPIEGALAMGVTATGGVAKKEEASDKTTQLNNAERAINRARALIEAYNVERLNPERSAQAYLLGANLYCLRGETDRAIDYLTSYADLCIGAFFPFKLKGDDFLTGIDRWLDSCEIGAALPRDERLVKLGMLQSLSMLPGLAILENEPQFKIIVKRLTDFAGLQ
ncbi:MAG: helix-turn-helix domain-containing protein [Lachnospiraceae bacterium]|jgi:transcriptional regulator with XRE-family HTH domain|nr:helix-turn-helix domain-containing protein [Lachnospiraceae bacterium]